MKIILITSNKLIERDNKYDKMSFSHNINYHKGINKIE